MQPDHSGTSKLNRATLAKVHVAKKALGLDDDDYRDLLERVCGKRSARFLLPEDLPALQREFRRLGWDGWLQPPSVPPSTGGGRPLKYEGLDNRPGRPNGKQLRMLEARFKSIRGFADINPDAAFRAFLHSRFGISDARLLDDASFEAALTAVKRLERERGMKER